MKPEIHKCPVCNGRGLVGAPPGVSGDAETFTSTDTGPWECQSCWGRGWLRIKGCDETEASESEEEQVF